MPVVAAARLEGHIYHGDSVRYHGSRVTLTDEILGIGIVGFPHGENDSLRVGFERTCRHAVCITAGPNLFCHTESRPRFRPARVECGMGEYFGYLGSGHSVLLRRFEMVLERGIGQSLRHQGHYGYDGTVAERKQIVPAPYFPEKNIIVQTCKFGGKFSERVASGSLLDFYL